MKNIFRRPTASEAVESAKEIRDTQNEEVETVEGEADEAELKIIENDGVRFALLITATNNSEEAVIESILRSEGIPYIVRENDGESWMRVFMGFNFYGTDFYVPEDMLDDAAALLVPDDETDEAGDSDECDGE